MGGGDTTLTLYDQTQTQIDFDDDSGEGTFSRIERTCGVDELADETHWVRVGEFQNDETIAEYALVFEVTPCTDAIFTDGFESGDTSNWN